MDSSKTKILPALPVQFHAPFPSLSRAGKGEVDDRVPGLCPDFWYKLSLTLDLAVKSPFPTPLHPFLDLSKCQPPRLVQAPRSASAPALSPWSEQKHRHTHTPTCAHSHPHTAHTCTHSSLQAGRRQARVCLETQGWELMSPEEPAAPSGSCLPPAWALADGTFVFIIPVPWPDTHSISSLSRTPGLGSLPPRVHGLSIPTLPNPAVPIPTLSLASCGRGGGLCSERRQWSLSQLLYNPLFKVLFCSHLPLCHQPRYRNQ